MFLSHRESTGASGLAVVVGQFVTGREVGVAESAFETDCAAVAASVTASVCVAAGVCPGVSKLEREFLADRVGKREDGLAAGAATDIDAVVVFVGSGTAPDARDGNRA